MMWKALRLHWPEYLMEGAELGLFMVLAGLFATLIFSPASPLSGWISHPFWQRSLMGVIMGTCAIAIIYSPWGKRTGAHFNPAVTIAFYRLGKLAPWDAAFYVLAQFIGGAVGIALVAVIVGTPFTNLPVNYILTQPGIWGWLGAVVAEGLLAFSLMSMVLVVSNHPQFHQRTGIFAGVLVALFVTLAAPISGMSINPARSFASAFSAQIWTGFWIYYFVPPLAMLTAAELYQRVTGRRPQDICGKLCPNSDTPCPCIDCPCGSPPDASPLITAMTR